jgi:endonuclease IV
MNKQKIYEAQRLIRRANEISPEAMTLTIAAMQELCEGQMISKHALYFINMAIPQFFNKEIAEWTAK